MQNIIIANASPLLHDGEVRGYVPALQVQYDRDFKPAWGNRVPDVHFSFCPALAISSIAPDAWPIFLNRTSDDPDALGWHDDSGGRIFSRVFIADARNAGLDWGVTLSHEALEMALDPDIKRVWPMPDGRLAALEACDAVESDDQAYPSFGGLKVSNFVLPAYFSTGVHGPWDFLHKLDGPCPALTPGGYMDIADSAGNFKQIEERRVGRRASSKGHRRLRRATRSIDELEIVRLV